MFACHEQICKQRDLSTFFLPVLELNIKFAIIIGITLKIINKISFKIFHVIVLYVSTMVHDVMKRNYVGRTKHFD